ncbi:DUF1289 domain-containing protein, partial [Afifella pfennigii]|uniref:DUF1289 domain-containing protein n=1 Tax=Afifella pfennigii TaxID=209897 RepID=UPI0012EC132A
MPERARRTQRTMRDLSKPLETTEPGAARRPGSPCTGLCRIDPASGYCLGCARSGEEIAIWG